jgi:hypothetical protein
MKKVLMAILVMLTFLEAGITFGTGSKVNFGNANVGVYGNLKNLGTITTTSTSRLSFLGSAQDSVFNITTFPNITMNKSAGNLRLMQNLSVTGNIAFTKGNIMTGANTFEVGSSATVTGESTTGYIVGTVKAARAVGTGSSTFGGIGYSLGSGTGNLGTVTVYRYTGDGSEVLIYGTEGIWRKWTVETSNAFSGTRAVTSYWFSNEDNGNNLSSLKVWKYEPSKSSGEIRDIREIKKIKFDIENISVVKSKGIEGSQISDSAEPEVEVVEFDPPQDDSKNLYWVEVSGATFSTASSPRSATYTINGATSYTICSATNAFADGAGTEANPYQVQTLDQLNNVRNFPSAHFIQIADIDASATSTWNSNAGWIPINNFTGKYNGDGHTVSNLFISRAGTQYVGLFGYTTSGSEIKDLGLENVNFTGGDYTGGLIGMNRGTLRNCYSEGQIKSSTGYLAGGLVAYATTGSNIYDCYSNVEVTRSSGGTYQYVGGFCGYHGSGQIYRCYSTGSVHYEGATDPTNKGFTSYTPGTVSGNFWNTETSGQLTSVGATGLTKTQMRTLLTFTNAAWDFQAESVNGTEDLWGINGLLNSGYPFLSWEGLRHRPSPFAGGIGSSEEPFMVSSLTQLDSVRNWMSSSFLQTADIDATPTAAWKSGGWLPIGSVTTKFTGSYDGQGYTIDGLYINRTTEYNGFFGYVQGSTISHIILSNANVTSNQYYTGVLSGYINDSEVNSCTTGGNISGSRFTGGISGYNYSSIFTDCISNTSVTGSDLYTGGIAGYNYYSSSITRCSSTGNVTGTTYVGGITGRSITSSTISNSFTKGTISGINYVGGFIGQNYTSCLIENCYSLSNVKRLSGTLTYFAGFVGQNNSGTINNCYSTGSVKHADGTNLTNRGFIASIITGYVMNGNFWNTETSEQTGNGVTGTATGITSSQMRTSSTFTNAGWDFYGESVNGTNDYWNIHTSLNTGFPYLNWEYRLPVEAPSNIVLAVSGTDVIITWDPVTNAAGYAVYSSADPYGTFVLDESGVFDGPEWTAAASLTKKFYYITATNLTKEAAERSAVKSTTK